MFEFISALLKDVLPNREQGTFSWTFRIVVLSAILFIFGTSLLNVILSTTLGEQYGIQRNSTLPNLAHADLLTDRQQVWHILSRLRVENENVRAVFFLALFDRKTRNFVLEDSLKPEDTELAIWEWEIPVRKYSSLDSIKGILNLKQEEIEIRIRSTKACYTNKLENEYLSTFKRAIPDFVATHISFCPVYTTANPRLIGITMMLFRLVPPLEPQEHEERLKDASAYVQQYFKEFSVQYRITYE